VNATSVGLSEPVKDFLVDVDTLHSGQMVVDVVYGSQRTAFVRAATAHGAAAIDGREMLVRQAAASYGLWTTLNAPLEVMRQAIDRHER
ncbi:MAG: shikimate dehydrogenase, partial [Thermoleophilia bacterium]|nr:shikimate dehydrogenase [Thermoleophilia bacterium]